MRVLHAIALVALIAAETLIFLVATRHHYAWSYPRWDDQVQYLGQSYGTYERARIEGYGAAAWSGITEVSAQGCLHEVLTLPVFAVFGASRTAALALNMLAFAALQVATFLAVRRASASYAMAWASIGLLMALRFPWSGAAGSAVDFRLDWMAACAYGVALAVAIAGRGFRSGRWALALGAVIGVTILLRFLTAVYFGLIFVVLLAWILFQRDRWARCSRMAITGIVALCIVGPTLLRDHAAIYSYYWLDHFRGAGRVAHDSHFGAVDSVRWLIKQAIFYQIGLMAFALGVVATVLLVASKLGSPSNLINPRRTDRSPDGAWAITIVFLCVPAAVLCFFPVKDEPPASILIPGAVWIVFLLWSRLVRQVRGSLATAIGVGVLAAGALIFIRAQAATTPPDDETLTYRKINGLDDFLFFRSETAGLAHPRVEVPWLLNGVDAGSFRILTYERHHRMLGFTSILPTGLSRTSPEIAINALSDSDFVCLVTGARVDWPFDKQMDEMLPRMRGWCQSHMTYVGSLDTSGYSISVFERKALKAMPVAQNADFASLITETTSGISYRDATIPGPPIFVSEGFAIASTGNDFRYRLIAAISPLHFTAQHLPEGLAINQDTGEIAGRFPRSGDFTADVSAVNAIGATPGKLEFHVEDGRWFAFLSGPHASRSGTPFDVKFGAFDAARTLDFIDVTDLTLRRTLERLVATDEERQSWSGVHQVAISQPGPHIILMRFVRYDPSSKEPYSFIDHQCEVDISK